MSTQIPEIKLDDTLQYKVYVSKAVPRGDVTLNAFVTLIVAESDNAPDTINQRVMEALQAFLPTPWEVVSTDRTGLSPGYEQVRVKVLSRVPAEENRNLEERARKAARVGLSIGDISVNRALPQDVANQIVKSLWFEAVRKVNEHLKEFEEASGRQWRIGDIVFGVPNNGGQQRSVKGGYRDEIDDFLSGLVESGLAGAEKISLVADVTLKSARPQ